MSAVNTQPIPSEKNTDFLLFREESERFVLFLMFAVVSLWVSVDVTDSTILKPYFLIVLSLLLVSLRLARVLAMGRLSWKRTIADPWVLLYLFILAVSWAFSENRLFGTTALLFSLASAVCFFSGVQFAGGKIDSALNFLLAISCLLCIIAVLQFVAGDQLGIDFGLGATRRVVSTLGNSTYLAGFLAMIIPLTLGRMLDSANRKRRRVMAGLIVLMLVTIFLTQSRSGLLALVLAIILFFILYNRGNPGRTFLTILAAVTVCGILLLFFPGMGDRLMALLDPTEDSSFARRMPFWEAGWEGVLSAPLLGNGPASVPFVIAKFRRADYWMNGSEDIVPHVHNEVLEAAVESGLPGALLLCGFVVVVLLQGWRGGVKRGSALQLGITCGIVAVVIDNMTGVSLRHPPVAMVAWFLAGLLFSPMKERIVQVQIPFRGSRLAALVSLAAWVLIAVPLGGEALEKLGSDGSLQSGRVASRAGKHQIAADHFRAAVQQDPGSLIASYELCVAQLRTGAFREALLTAEGLREIAPDYPKVGLLESLAWLELDSLRLARLAIDEELRRRDHPESFYTRSLIAARLDDTTGVRSSLEKVLERNIAAYSTIHLDGACRTLLEIVRTEEDLKRFASLLEQLSVRNPANDMITVTLAEVRKRLQQKVTA